MPSVEETIKADDLNGFSVTGESACASRGNFNEAFGRELARKAAIDKVWMLEGYPLRERLHDLPNPASPQATIGD